MRLVFNGEIYNHAEIRAELEALGGHTLPHRPLRHRGDRARLRGVGHRLPPALPRHVRARALGRARRSELWLVRDRIGIKPLYYVGPSRPARLRAPRSRRCSTDPEQARAVDEEALYHYLSFLTTPAPQTLFEGIRKLPGGTLAAGRADGDDRASSATGTSGTTSTPLDGVLRGRDRRARARRAAHVGAAAQGERRAGRRVPVRRHRLEHERGAVLRGRERAGQDVLDRLRGRVRRRYQNEFHYARADGRARRRRAPRAAS